MPPLGIDLLTVTAVIAVVVARPAVALAILLGAAVLIPSTLIVPSTHFSYLTVQHVLAGAAVLRLVHRALAADLPTPRLGGGPALAALAAVVAVSFVVGLVGSASNSYSIDETARLIDLGTQLVFLVVTVALVRELPSPWQALQIAAVLLVASAGVGWIEHFTHHAWGQWLFSRLPGHPNTNAAQRLDVRATQPRVRAGSEFALEFAWVSVLLLPALLVVVVRSRAGRFAALAAAGFVLAAVYWSYARSALAFALITLLVVALVARDSRLVSVVVVGVAAALVGYALHPSVLQHLSAATDENSISVRFIRLHLVLQQLTAHPFRGVGLGNLSSTGVLTTDNALLLSLAEGGAFGLTALAALFVTVVVQGARSVAAARPDERWVAVACLGGIVTYVAAAQFYDAFTLIQGPQLLWFLVGLAAVVAERGGRPVRLPRPSRELVLGVAAVAVAASGAVVAVAPHRISADYAVTALPPVAQLDGYASEALQARFQRTVCAEVPDLATAYPSVTAECSPISALLFALTLHVEGPSHAAVVTAADGIIRRMRHQGGLPFVRAQPTAPPAPYTPPMWRSAPVPITVGALLLLWLVPWRRRHGARRAPVPPRHAVLLAPS